VLARRAAQRTCLAIDRCPGAVPPPSVPDLRLVVDMAQPLRWGKRSLSKSPSDASQLTPRRTCTLYACRQPRDIAMPVEETRELVAPSSSSVKRHVTVADIAAFCSRCKTSLPAVAASTAARPPARVTLEFACPCAPQGVVSITVEELTFASGGLGFRLFPGAVWLAAWLAEHFVPRLQNDDSVQRAGQTGSSSTVEEGCTLSTHVRVLELGAGLALCGLTVAVAATASRAARAHIPQVHVTLTDFNAALLAAASTAAADNGVAECVSTSMFDWVVEAATQTGRIDRDRNPEYFRVLESADTPSSVKANNIIRSLPPDAVFDVIIASEVLYEHATASSLPVALLRRVPPLTGGRFCMLMAVRDTELLSVFVSTLCEWSRAIRPRLDLHICVAPASALPLPPHDAATEQDIRVLLEKQPLCTGLIWMSLSECERMIRHGEPAGGALSSAWVEAMWAPSSPSEGGSVMEQQAVQVASLGQQHCCSRNARGLACPCRRR
jgi:Lysine methyltransferase